MMNFDLSSDKMGSAVSESTVLEANAIHEVTFKGIEFRLSKSKKHCFMVTKFAGVNGGFFSDLHFGPDPEKKDWEKDSTTAWGAANPSKEKSFNIKVKHLLNAVAPGFLQKLVNGEVAFKSKSNTQVKQFEDLVNFLAEGTKEYIGSTTKIKLLADNKGEAKFPAFYSGYNRDNQVILKTNFIGDNISITTYEKEAIAKRAAAVPTSMPATPVAGIDLSLNDEPSVSLNAENTAPADDLLNMNI